MAPDGSGGCDPGLCCPTIMDDGWQAGGSGEGAASLWVAAREVWIDVVVECDFRGLSVKQSLWL